MIIHGVIDTARVPGVDNWLRYIFLSMHNVIIIFDLPIIQIYKFEPATHVPLGYLYLT